MDFASCCHNGMEKYKGLFNISKQKDIKIEYFHIVVGDEVIILFSKKRIKFKGFYIVDTNPEFKVGTKYLFISKNFSDEYIITMGKCTGFCDDHCSSMRDGGTIRYITLDSKNNVRIQSKGISSCWEKDWYEAYEVHTFLESLIYKIFKI